MLVSLCTATAADPVPISLADLPQPPREIAELLNRAEVTFEWGGRDAPTESAGGARRSAETKYDIAYNYASRARWRVNKLTNQVTVTVRYGGITWKPTHRVWFRQRPQTEGVWTDPLMLHELDHVQISSDVRIEKRFEQQLRGQRRLTFSLAGRGAVNAGVIDRLIDEHVDKVADATRELIAIRYKELDRLTAHGQRPVPENFQMAELLRKHRQPAGAAAND